MTFVQIIQFQTSKFDEMEALGNEWEAAAGAEATVRRRILCKDRDREGQYLNIVFFDSYEDAMRNSENPVTQEFSQRMQGLSDGTPEFSNLDVIQDVTLS